MAPAAAPEPDCPYTGLQPSGVECPECRNAEIMPVRGRFGPMWACGDRPRCGFWLGSRPTGRNCQHPRDGGRCGRLMMEGTRTIPERCSDKSCPNHRPDRLAGRGRGR